MSHKNNLIWGVTFAVLIAVMLCPIISAEESPKIDGSTPIEELQTLASGGNADAMLELGERLVQGQGVDTNATEGMQWIQKAADAGKTSAWYDLGVMYSNGMGVTTDMAKAMSYYRTGAEKGNSDCQTSLGLFYQAGERIPGGAKADPVEAVKWYKLAAEQNHEEAIQHLAMMNARGMGIEQNDLEAVRWFRKGAELGNADCKWGLGQCYFDGKGVAKDNVQAYALWVAAIDGAEDPEQKKGMSEQLDKLGKEMTPEQVARGQELSKEWIAKKNKE